MSGLMQRLKTGLAVRFNLRHERQGHVFESRFGSRLVRDDADFLNLLCYVHRNPLKAGLVQSAAALERYPWTSYGALLGRRPPYPFEAVSACLALLDDTEEAAQRRIRDAMTRANELQLETRHADGAEARLQALVEQVCADAGVSALALREGARDGRVSRARTRICRVAVQELGIRPAAVALALGISRAAVTFALRRHPPGGSF